MRTSGAAFLLAAALAAASCGGEARTPDDAPPGLAETDAETVVGLSTSLPILWSESADIAGLLAEDAPPHWALGELRRTGRVQPLDTLADEGGAMPLRPDALLVMAQPWPLSPDENVALDDWVRSGGHVLLFADPMLTFHSAFALGDRRRPQDMALLSPILSRWGLVLRFDEDQPAGERAVQVAGAAMPVNLPGFFELAHPENSPCVLEAGGLAAQCVIGRGRVLAVADAALLEARTDGPDGPRAHALATLLERLDMSHSGNGR